MKMLLIASLLFLSACTHGQRMNVDVREYCRQKAAQEIAESVLFGDLSILTREPYEECMRSKGMTLL